MRLQDAHIILDTHICYIPGYSRQRTKHQHDIHCSKNSRVSLATKKRTGSMMSLFPLTSEELWRHLELDVMDVPLFIVSAWHNVSWSITLGRSVRLRERERVLWSMTGLFYSDISHRCGSDAVGMFAPFSVIILLDRSTFKPQREKKMCVRDLASATGRVHTGLVPWLIFTI